MFLHKLLYKDTILEKFNKVLELVWSYLLFRKFCFSFRSSGLSFILVQLPLLA
jgi:hypothetical protein